MLLCYCYPTFVIIVLLYVIYWNRNDIILTKFSATDCLAGHQNYKFWKFLCSQWWKFCENDNIPLLKSSSKLMTYLSSTNMVLRFNSAPPRISDLSHCWFYDYSKMTSSNGNIFCIIGHLCGEFTGPRWIPPAQRPVTWSFDVFFDLGLNKRLSKQSWGWWFETLLCPLWRHFNADKYLVLIAAHTVMYTGWHYDDVIMTRMASQITSLAIVYSTV